MTENDHADVKRLSFEKAIEELESIVKRLEEGKVPLEESVAIYERGEALKRRCEELLRQAEARVEKITLDASASPRAPSRWTLDKTSEPASLMPCAVRNGIYGGAPARKSLIIQHLIRRCHRLRRRWHLHG